MINSFLRIFKGMERLQLCGGGGGGADFVGTYGGPSENSPIQNTKTHLKKPHSGLQKSAPALQ